MSKRIRVNVSLPSDVLDRIDEHAQAEGLSRSGFLVHAARKILDAA